MAAWNLFSSDEIRKKEREPERGENRLSRRRLRRRWSRPISTFPRHNTDLVRDSVNARQRTNFGSGQPGQIHFISTRFTHSRLGSVQVRVNISQRRPTSVDLVNIRVKLGQQQSIAVETRPGKVKRREISIDCYSY
ncbi:hypothetical protein HanXRQr2_Chr10g0463841 [Helianthus annuus]|uniref:Uncharacterized protein n=1 Tax=Helianthus annuus TaxID=4232 RepID=A0A251TRG9_HELAN|nr:uncharacterized protein LOC110883705 [Helianthus annuus]KAF5788424.1 hypothetical protein HanXRQr2_Chr10g0463841 [Helianthus annuus]KAJ0885662.1 hypothetical protein HanPSC8_Chr10g0447651 [Helianthus annuus]